jgi:hypothetical protein
LKQPLEPPGFGCDDETEDYWSGSLSNAGSGVSTDEPDSTTDSDKTSDFNSSTYSSYASKLGEPAYVRVDLPSEFQSIDLGQGMLGDYMLGASLGEPAKLGFGFDWGN